MRPLWTFVKVIIGLAIAIPICLLVLGVALGLLRLALRIAILGAVGYVIYRVARAVLAPSPAPALSAPQPAPDPYYAAAMRELDREIR